MLSSLGSIFITVGILLHPAGTARFLPCRLQHILLEQTPYDVINAYVNGNSIIMKKISPLIRLVCLCKATSKDKVEVILRGLEPEFKKNVFYEPCVHMLPSSMVHVLLPKSTKDAPEADKECQIQLKNKDAAFEECALADFIIRKVELCQKPKRPSSADSGGLLPMTMELGRIAMSTVMRKAQVTCVRAMVGCTFYRDLRLFPLIGIMGVLSQGLLSKSWSRGTVNAIFLAAIGARTMRLFGRWS